jgi:hypothetical protein
MQTSTQRRPHYIAAVPAAIPLEEQPSRHWILSLIAASAATWAMIFGAAKLLLAFV